MPPIKIDRGEAVALAEQALQERGVVLGPEWKRLAIIRLGSEDASASAWNRFVWREAGPDTYHKLIGSWLAPPLWEVRFARFSGVDVADRAEEWHVTLQGDGKLRQVAHELPELRPGARLTEDAGARAGASARSRRSSAWIRPRCKEVEVKQDPHPARTDWGFVYTDPRVNVGKGGEARALVNIAGDEVSGWGRYIFIPEEWSRAERNRASRLGVLRIGITLALALATLAGLIGATLAWTRDHFDRRAFRWTAALVFVAAVISQINQWPALAIGLRTTEPVFNQVALSIAGRLFVAVLTALVGGMFAGVGALAARVHITPGLDAKALWLRGGAVALVAVGIDVALGALTPETAPLWPKYDAENSALPWLARALYAVNFLPVVGFTLVVLHWLDRMTAGWTRRRVLATVLLMLADAAIAAISAEHWYDIVVAGVVGGAVSTLLFAAVLRFDLRAVPPLIAVYVIPTVVAQALQKGTAQGILLGAIGVVATLAVAWAVTRYLIAGGQAALPGRTGRGRSPRTGRRRGAELGRRASARATAPSPTAE